MTSFVSYIKHLKNYVFKLKAKYGRYAPILLAPAEGLPSRASKGSLRSLPIACTQGLATLASHHAHARARYARFTSRARKSLLHSLPVMLTQGLAALAYRCAHARVATLACHLAHARTHYSYLACTQNNRNF